MRRFLAIISTFVAFLFSGNIHAQDNVDVFYPIAKYIEQGDALKLSAWFDEHLELSVNGVSGDYGKNQARQIMKSFFMEVKPDSFVIMHTASKANMKYALGTMTVGSEVYDVTIFVNLRDDSYRIQQLKFEKK